MAHQIRLTLQAEKDLRDIFTFIARDNPDAARTVIDQILERLHLLENFPMGGHPFTEIADRNLREIVVSHYRLIYEVDSASAYINVIRIWHGARGIPRIAKRPT